MEETVKIVEDLEDLANIKLEKGNPVWLDDPWGKQLNMDGLWVKQLNMDFPWSSQKYGFSLVKQKKKYPGDKQ